MLIMHGNKTLSLFSCHIVDIRPGQRLAQISLDIIRQMVIKLQTILIYGCGMDFQPEQLSNAVGQQTNPFFSCQLWNMMSGTGTYISFNI